MDAIVCIAILGYKKKNQPRLKHTQFFKNETPWIGNAQIKEKSSSINAKEI